MDGILLLQKPKGMTSHDCVDRCRKLFNTRKVGHAGTLDPEAEGVLVLGINKGTKIMPYLNQDTKAYRFGVVFNEETDTLDHTGEVVRTVEHHDFSMLEAALKQFRGDYLQTPPAYSAVKVNGKKLYEYARKGEAIPDVPPRKIRVYALKTERSPKPTNGLYEAEFYVKGSKGLFVRQLAKDIALKFGTTARTSFITRVQSGRFTIEEAHSFEAIENGRHKLLTLSEALSHLPAFTAHNEAAAVKKGRPLEIDHDAELLRVVDNENRLLALYRRDNGRYRAERVFL